MGTHGSYAPLTVHQHIHYNVSKSEYYMIPIEQDDLNNKYSQYNHVTG